jgi:hypothetical protein
MKASMTPQNPFGCGGCHQVNLLPISREKWGRCPLCMALAASAAVLGWSFTLSFWLLYPDRRVALGLAGLAALFTVVLALHAVAHRIREAAHRAEE